MVYKPHKSLSESDIREEASVDFVRSLLGDCGVKTALTKGDKGANIDGYIELLDSENRINGKITAQVKTVPPSNEGKYVYDCPTALLGYAEQTTEVVFLMAVDHKNKTVLWKYISRKLLDDNLSKADQETIRMNFDEDERLTVVNVDETIRRWRALVGQQLKLYNDAPVMAEENDRLREEVLKVKGIEFTMPAEEIQKIQSFIDCYNSVMDRELKFIKEFLYPNTWKFGIAIIEYEDDRLSYCIYSVKKGETAPLVKQMPQDYRVIHQMRYDVMTGFNMENPMRNDYRQLVRRRIKDHISQFLSHYKELPMTIPVAMERVASYFEEDYNGIVVPLEMRDDFNKMVDWMSENIGYVLRPRTQVIYGFHQTRDFFELYNSLKFLISEGYHQLQLFYPQKGKYGNTSTVYDWYNADTAYEKTRHVIGHVYAIYDDFIKERFPLLVEELDLGGGADLMHVDVEYGERHGLNTYYFDTEEKGGGRILEFSKNGESTVLKDLFSLGFRERFNTPIDIQGKKFVLRSINQSLAFKTLISSTPLQDTFFELMKSKFEALSDKITLPEG